MQPAAAYPTNGGLAQWQLGSGCTDLARDGLAALLGHLSLTLWIRLYFGGCMVRVLGSFVITLLVGCSLTQTIVPSPALDRFGRMIDVDSLGKQQSETMEWPLCMSGGGYRAMLFHAGVLMAMNDMHLLPSMNRYSAVSGGSITQAKFALAYRNLDLDREHWKFTNLDQQVVQPLENVATTKTMDTSSVIAGLLVPGTSTSTFLMRAYDRALFHYAKIGDLPMPDFTSEEVRYPIFIFRSTELGTGLPWDFTNYYTGSDELGKLPLPTLRLSTVVAASSAYPPVFSPVKISLEDLVEKGTVKYPLPAGEEEAGWHQSLESKFANLQTVASELTLVDGGVYDNLGLSGCLGEELRGGAVISNAASLSVPHIPKSRWGWLSLSVDAAGVIHSRVGQELTKRVVPTSRADLYVMATKIAGAEGDARARLINTIIEKETFYPTIVALSDVRSVLLWQELRAVVGDVLDNGTKVGQPQLGLADIAKLTCLASVDTRLKQMSPASARALINLGYIQTFATEELGRWATAMAKAYKATSAKNGKILIEIQVGTFQPPRAMPTEREPGCSESETAWLQGQITSVQDEMHDVDLKSLLNVGGKPPRK